MTKLTEAAFLKLPPRQQDAFIAEKVFGYELISPRTYKHNFPDSEDWCAVPIPYYTDKEDWDAMRLGVEKANEEGFRFSFVQRRDLKWYAGITSDTVFQNDTPLLQLPLAFWIALLRALGIIEE